LTKQPEDVDTHYSLGVAYKNNGLKGKAIYEFEEVVKFQPGNIFALNNIGTIHLDQGQYEDAVSVYKEVLQINPDHVDGLYNLGLTYYFKGVLDPAINTWEKAAKINPFYKDLQNNLIVSYNKKKELSEKLIYGQRKTLNDEHVKFDKEFSVALPAQKKEEEMQVVNRRKLLPAVTVGLTKEEAAKLAKVLKESNVEIKFCLDLLADLDLVELEEVITKMNNTD
jgi:tetratricopeptide (TPR) repeat protein